jgi:hypothetical protein
MGTNYYTFTERKCKHKEKEEYCWNCFNTGFEKLHIGKSSVGWQFSFKGYKHFIETFQDWEKFLKDKKIYNEYGEEVTYDELFDRILDKQSNPDNLNHTEYCRREYITNRTGELVPNYQHSLEHGWNDCEIDPKGYSFSFCEFS